MIASIGSSNMLPRTASIHQNVTARMSKSEETMESTSERMLEAHSSPAKAAKTQSPNGLGNVVDKKA
ncbi:MAG: hypothetical protein P4L59_15465 [Desulfosporosinus sp.]|nr:hypothetical protein [Desulfosporosinus sp.]